MNQSTQGRVPVSNLRPCGPIVEKAHRKRVRWAANAPHKLQGRGAVTAVWGSTGGSASPYTNRWPRPANFMPLLDDQGTGVSVRASCQGCRVLRSCVLASAPDGQIENDRQLAKVQWGDNLGDPGRVGWQDQRRKSGHQVA